MNRTSTLVFLAALAAASASCGLRDDVSVPVRAEPLPELPAPAAGAEPSDPQASADASADPDGSPSADAAAPPPPPALMDEPPSNEKTKAPGKGEWASAPAVRLARVKDPSCSAKRIREWVRIYCSGYYDSISVVSGTREGIDVAVRESDPSGAFVIFPVRKGDRRLILLQTRTKWASVPSGIISEQWLESDKGPIVTVLPM